MYADREVTVSKSSVRDRLDGNSEENFNGRKRQINGNGKRQRQSEDKWEHDLYDDDDDDEPQVSNPKVDPRDLRSKLQKKSLQQINRSGKGSIIGGTRDLREKLSGTMRSQPANADTPKANPVSEVVKPARKSTAVDVPVPETKKAANLASSKKKSQKKADSVDGFLQSLGLEKYLITFQAEEVDMTALIHMTEEDLKALGIPMGPRKKILLALDSRA